MVAAIADSTSRDGRATSSSVARISVIECATVNAVTTLATSTAAGRKALTACQRPCSRRTTAGSSSVSRNSTWS